MTSTPVAPRLRVFAVPVVREILAFRRVVRVELILLCYSPWLCWRTTRDPDGIGEMWSWLWLSRVISKRSGHYITLGDWRGGVRVCRVVVKAGIWASGRFGASSRGVIIIDEDWWLLVIAMWEIGRLYCIAWPWGRLSGCLGSR